MNNTETEGLITYLIPAEKRNEYFEYVDMFKGKVKNVTEEELREGEINTENLYSGIYNLSLYSNHQLIETKKIVLTKD